MVRRHFTLGGGAPPLLPLLLLAACGGDTTPRPGYADPCTTPMASVLGCPAASITSPADSIADACGKLTNCGILADRNLYATSTVCTAKEDCNKDGSGPGGECLANNSGNLVCHYHSLDYFWCVLRFSDLPQDPCDSRSLQFTAENADAAVACIAANDCSVLGASFTEKSKHSAGKVADNDRYICKSDGKTGIWTATICDGGILNYAR